MAIQVGDRRTSLVDASEPQVRAWRSLHEAGGWGDVEGAYANARSFRKNDPAALKWLDKWEAKGAKTVDDAGGHTYEVNINASLDDLLDLDAPLSQQSPQVREALDQVFDSEGPMGRALRENIETVSDPVEGVTRLARGNDLKRGHEVVNFLERSASHVPQAQRAASARLRDAGIPGSKYYDQMSRGAGEGTRNYVMFDDTLIDILRKFGLVLAAGAGAEGVRQGRR